MVKLFCVSYVSGFKFRFVILDLWFLDCISFSEKPGHVGLLVCVSLVGYELLGSSCGFAEFFFAS